MELMILAWWLMPIILALTLKQEESLGYIMSSRPAHIPYKHRASLSVSKTKTKQKQKGKQPVGLEMVLTVILVVESSP